MSEIVNAGAPSMPGLPSVSVEECDVHDFTTEGGLSYGNADRAKDQISGLIDSIGGFMYMFLVQGTMFTLITLVAFYSTFRWVSRLAGADVDIMALMKIA